MPQHTQPVLRPTDYVVRFFKKIWHTISAHYRSHIALYWIAGIFIFLSCLYQYLLLKHYSQYIYDLGMWNRHFWSLIHLDFGPNPLKGFNLLGDHFHVLLIALAPLYALYQHVEFFFVVQAVAVGVSIFPLFLIARKYFSAWRSYAWIIIYLSYFGFWSAFTYDFHEIIVGVPIIAWLLYFYVEGKWRPLFITAMVLLLLREDMPLYVMALGLVTILFKRKYRLGLGLIVIAFTYFMLVTNVVIPSITGMPYALYRTPLGNGMVEIIKNGILHPKLLFSTFFTPQIKIEVMAVLFASFGFLALLSLDGLILLIPPFVARFLSVQTFRWNFAEHYSATQGPIMFVAAMLGTATLLRLLAKYRPHLKKEMVTTCITIAAVATALVASAGAQMRVPTYSRLTNLDFYHRNDIIRSTDKAVKLIPPDASVAASSSFPQLTGRRDIYLWPAETDGSRMPLKLSTVRPQYIIVSLKLDDAYMPQTYEQLLQKIEDDKKLGYHQIFNQNGAIVLKRND